MTYGVDPKAPHAITVRVNDRITKAEGVAGPVTVAATSECETALIRPSEPLPGMVVPVELQHTATTAIEAGRHIRVDYSRARKMGNLATWLVPMLAGVTLAGAAFVPGAPFNIFLLAGLVSLAAGVILFSEDVDPFTPKLYRRALALRGTIVCGEGRESVRVWRQAVERVRERSLNETALPAIHKLALTIADAEDEVDRLQTARSYLPGDQGVEQAKRYVAELVAAAEILTGPGRILPCRDYLADRWADTHTDQMDAPIHNQETLR